MLSFSQQIITKTIKPQLQKFCAMSLGKVDKKEILSYNTSLRAEIETDVNEAPRARVHSVEWRKIMEGEPVEINPSIGHGYKIMTVDEWAGRWKRNDDFPECLNCNSKNTKEHHFTQAFTLALCFAKRNFSSLTAHNLSGVRT